MTLSLTDAAEYALAQAAALGLDQAEVSVHAGTGVSLTARNQQLETVEKHNDSQLLVNVYVDHKTGSASSADLSQAGIDSTMQAAASIAKHTGQDDCLGLADAQRMASTAIDLDLYHPWTDDLTELFDIARRCEQAALQYDSRISNSEGASVNSYAGSAVYANSHGFISQYNGSQHGLSCAVVGSSANGMQRDYWYDGNRNAAKLMPAEALGHYAAERTVKRLDARKITSTRAAVLFDPAMAKSLISHLLAALKGGIIYKKASFLLDRVGDKILPDFFSLSENPHLIGGASSAWHDSEGVATPARDFLVKDGVLQRYVLGSYAARKLGLPGTANAGGTRNLRLESPISSTELINQMGSGLLVTELIGSGINMVTGDYSRGAAGFWVENGEIAYPVEEVTIAGNLIDMFQQIVALGNDMDHRGNIACGSILIDSLTIAGA